MKWFTDFFAKRSNVKFAEHDGTTSVFIVPSEVADSPLWSDELFNLCWEREALIVEIDAAKRQKKKSSHLIAALVKNTQRRLELELAHNGKNGAA